MAEFDTEAIASTLNAAALDPEQWDCAIEEIVRATSSYGVIIFPLRGTLPYVPATKSMGEAFDLYVRDGWVHRDERIIRGTNKLMKKAVLTDRDMISEQEVRRHPYYQDFLGRTNLKGWAAVRIGGGDQAWSLTFHRNKQQGEFSAAELRDFHELSRQLASTAQIASALAFAQGQAALSTFEIAGKAALLLNRVGEVVLANSAAEQLFNEHVNIVKRRLFCSDRQATDHFERALKQLLWSADRGGVPPIALPRPGKSAVVAYLMRSYQLADTPLSTYHAIAVLVDPDARLAPVISTLKAMFGLTPAEARLAVALQSGNDVSEASVHLHISSETARKHLRSIFAKTGTRRQADLVALISNLLPNA